METRCEHRTLLPVTSWPWPGQGERLRRGRGRARAPAGRRSRPGRSLSNASMPVSHRPPAARVAVAAPPRRRDYVSSPRRLASARRLTGVVWWRRRRRYPEDGCVTPRIVVSSKEWGGDTEACKWCGQQGRCHDPCGQASPARAGRLSEATRRPGRAGRLCSQQEKAPKKEGRQNASRCGASGRRGWADNHPT